MSPRVGNEAQLPQDLPVVLRPYLFLSHLQSGRGIQIDSVTELTIPAGSRIKYLGDTKDEKKIVQLIRADIGPATSKLFMTSVAKEEQRKIHREHRGSIFVLDEKDEQISILWEE